MTSEPSRDMVSIASALVGRRLHLVARLTGGEHAVTAVATDGCTQYVIRRFPAGDPAVTHELDVLGRLETLADLVPHPVAYSHDADGPLLVTNRLEGAHPSPTLAYSVFARQMAAALARIHELDGAGLRPAPAVPPTGNGPAARAAQRQWAQLNTSDRVLTHYDYWCGNALWTGPVLTGIVDWSGARNAPRGVDLAWCRLDLVLLGSPAAADLFLVEYERFANLDVADVHAWDLQAAAQAESAVEGWAPNYSGIGRGGLTPAVLRERLSAWTHTLLA